MDDTQKPRSLILNLLQPGVIALITAMFFLGVGLAHYFGSEIEWWNCILACACLFFLIWSRNLLGAYFDHPESPFRLLLTSHPRYSQLVGVKRNNFLTFGLLAMTAGAVVTVMILAGQPQNLVFIILLGIAVVGAFFSVVPPIHLQRRGYGEITESVIISILTPAIGIVLNYGEIKPILVMFTLPVMLLYLAAKLVFIFPDYLADKKGGNPNLLNRLDWARSMRLHNLLVMAAFLFVGVFAFIGLPWPLAWPMILPLPFGVFQVVQMLGILNGAKPRWLLLKWTAGATVGLIVYLVLLTLWLN